MNLIDREAKLRKVEKVREKTRGKSLPVLIAYAPLLSTPLSQSNDEMISSVDYNSPVDRLSEIRLGPIFLVCIAVRDHRSVFWLLQAISDRRNHEVLSGRISSFSYTDFNAAICNTIHHLFARSHTTDYNLRNLCSHGTWWFLPSTFLLFPIFQNRRLVQPAHRSMM